MFREQNREESNVKKENNINIKKYNGLTNKEAENLLNIHGENKLVEKNKRTLFNMIIDQFKDFTIILLLIAAVLSIFLGEILDGSVIIGIVIINAFLGTYQERKASNALAALQSMSAPKAKVIRNGELVSLDSSKIVLGDLILLEAGDYVPADMKLIESVNLKVDESALTGESVAVLKDINKENFKNSSKKDIKINKVFSGTIVTYGRGKAIVEKIGMNTEIGNIAKMLNESEDTETPLQEKLSKFGKMLGMVCVLVGVLIIILGLIRKEDIFIIFMTAVSLAVAAIPEGLPAVVTTVLALGMQRMVKRNAIVKKLSAVETLGSTTTICSDKTGTLTQNKMMVTKIFANNKEYNVSGIGYNFDGKIEATKQQIQNIKLLLLDALLCNDSVIKEGECIGDPTEGALVTLAEKAGLSQIKFREQYLRIKEYPFDSERKMMSTMHKVDDKVITFTKGALDNLLDKCKYILIDGEEEILSENKKNEILNLNNKYASEALRVIGYAKRDNTNEEKEEINEEELTFLGFTGMIDPPREESKIAIEKCKKAGIRTVMITGDHIITGSAIAKKLGIINSEEEAIEGFKIENMTEEELVEVAKDTNVFARVSPEHKVRIVRAIQKSGNIVAMTGDGVNDAPALKNADIGVAMGITGTDVSKEAADMILTDDNFSSIVNAVEEGRIIYSNIRKFVGFLLSCNIGEILIILVSMIANWGIPLVPIQLLWVNLITDSFPAFALGMEKGEKNIMRNLPRAKDEPIVDKKMRLSIIFQSIGLTISVLIAYRLGYYLGIKGAVNDAWILARTFAFSTLILGEMLRAFSARREDEFLWKYKIFSNKFLNISVIIAVLLLVTVLYLPGLQVIFKTSALSMGQIAIVLGLSIIPLMFGEISKKIVKRIG
jgi:Ca2+-transporting ATPase